jgi:hypothetical protein
MIFSSIPMAMQDCAGSRIQSSLLETVRLHLALERQEREERVRELKATIVVRFRNAKDSREQEVDIKYSTVLETMPRQSFASYMSALSRLSKTELGRGKWEIIRIQRVNMDGTKARPWCLTGCAS